MHGVARPHGLPLATRPDAADVEAPAMAGEQVCVVGGANSAGQAALHLAKFAARGQPELPAATASPAWKP